MYECIAARPSRGGGECRWTRLRRGGGWEMAIRVWQALADGWLEVRRKLAGTKLGPVEATLTSRGRARGSPGASLLPAIVISLRARDRVPLVQRDLAQAAQGRQACGQSEPRNSACPQRAWPGSLPSLAPRRRPGDRR